MYVCRACLRRASTSLPRQVPTAQNAAPVRTFATTSILRQDKNKDWKQFEREVKRQQKEMPASDREDLRRKSAEKMRRATKKELQYAKDPYHIAENVSTKLKAGEFEKALMLTREASRDKQCVVSWNHLIEHEFQNHKLHAAIKLYNEMKKRAQLPNAQTFTIIFKGCADSQHPMVAVGEAVKIYNAMLASTRLKPNIIHLNAVLEVCARAQDLESLFVVLRSAEKSRSPNNRTYTIILNAMRHQRSNHKDFDDGSNEQQDEAIKKSVATTIQRSKLVWDEVMSRWKKGEIIMDEALLCAMGRVLLLGGPKETDAVLSLATDVLGVPRLEGDIPAIPKPDNEGPGVDSKSPPPQQQKPQRKQLELQGPSKPMAGNNTLSVIMRALGRGRLTKLAAKYWDYLTRRFNIVPDRRNYIDYIDTLSTGNASGKAARTIQTMPAEIVDGSIIRRGILLCHFDTYNHNAFDNADAVLEVMLRKMKTPDPKCLKLYLQIALSNYHKFDDREQYPTPAAGKAGYGHQMSRALDRVWEPLRLATNCVAFSDPATSSKSPEESWKRMYGDRQELLEVARRFVAVSDRILSQDLVPRGSEEHRVAVIRRKIMNDFVFRFYVRKSELNKIHVENDEADNFMATA